MEWLLTIAILPYLILLLYIYRHLQKTVPWQSGKVPELFVSVIVPCRNESDNIEGLLDSLAEQSYPSELFEVLVVDDNSDDITPGLASAFRRLNNLKVIVNEGSGKKHAIRTGVGKAQGDLIITTDADCRMGPGWISAIASYYTEHEPCLIISPVLPRRTPGFFGRFQEMEFLSLQGVTAGTATAGHPVMCNGANLAFTRETYEKHKGELRFDIASGDDIFLMHSIKMSGTKRIKWLESPAAAVTTAMSPRIDHFLRQRARWISKAGAYRDRFTILLGIVTFFTILFEFGLLAVLFTRPDYLPVLAVVFVIKSVPDLLIINNTAGRYSHKKLMRWFLPSQIIYPFYVFAVTLYAVLFPGSGSFSSPSPRGT